MCISLNLFSAGETSNKLEPNANSSALLSRENDVNKEIAADDILSEKYSSDNESFTDGSDYVPSDDEESDEISLEEADEGDKSTPAQPTAVNSSCDSVEYSLHDSFNVPGNSGCDKREQMPEKSRGPKGGQKKNFCFYCKTQQSKIVRHLENKHSDQIEVKKFMSLPVKSNEQREYIAKIRKKGNFLFNVNSDWNNGKLIPVRRPPKNEKRLGQNFVPCAKCRGFYSKNNIRHHYRQCTKSKGITTRNVLSLARQVVGRIHPSASLILRRDVFPILRDDNTTRTVRYDELLILYGNQ